MDASLTFRLSELTIPDSDSDASSSPVATPAQQAEIPDEALMDQLA
jgi:hypothetical protein